MNMFFSKKVTTHSLIKKSFSELGPYSKDKSHFERLISRLEKLAIITPPLLDLNQRNVFEGQLINAAKEFNVNNKNFTVIQTIKIELLSAIPENQKNYELIQRKLADANHVAGIKRFFKYIKNYTLPPKLDNQVIDSAYSSINTLLQSIPIENSDLNTQKRLWLNGLKARIGTAVANFHSTGKFAAIAVLICAVSTLFDKAQA